MSALKSVSNAILMKTNLGFHSISNFFTKNLTSTSPSSSRRRRMKNDEYKHQHLDELILKKSTQSSASQDTKSRTKSSASQDKSSQDNKSQDTKSSKITPDDNHHHQSAKSILKKSNQTQTYDNQGYNGDHQLDSHLKSPNDCDDVNLITGESNKKPRKKSYSLTDLTNLYAFQINLNYQRNKNSITKRLKRTFTFTTGDFKGIRIKRIKMGQNIGHGNSNGKEDRISENGNSRISRDNNISLSLSLVQDELAQLRSELVQTKKLVYEKDQEILKLHREIHKLKSVLDNQTKLKRFNLRQESRQQIIVEPGTVNIVSGTGNSGSGTGNPVNPAEGCGSQKSIESTMKKFGISSEPLSSKSFKLSTQFQFDIESKSNFKDFHTKQLIKDALLDNSFLKHFLDLNQLKMIVNSMYEKEFNRGELICVQGQYGSHLYVVIMIMIII